MVQLKKPVVTVESMNQNFYGLANPSMQLITLFSRRPQRITTEEFGRSLSYEKKVKLTTASVKQPAQFMKIMETAGFNSIPH